MSSFSILLTLVGWVAMAAYAIPGYLNRSPQIVYPPDGISLEWVELRDARLRCAVVTGKFVRENRLNFKEDRSSRELSTSHEAFVSAAFARREFGLGPLPRRETVRWSNLAVPIRGILTPPSGWNDIDVWIVQPSLIVE